MIDGSLFDSISMQDFRLCCLCFDGTSLKDYLLNESYLAKFDTALGSSFGCCFALIEFNYKVEQIGFDKCLAEVNSFNAQSVCRLKRCGKIE